MSVNQEEVSALTIALNLENRKIDQLIAQTESRRIVTLREVECRRNTLAQRLRDVTTEIQQEVVIEAAAVERRREHEPVETTQN